MSIISTNNNLFLLEKNEIKIQKEFKRDFSYESAVYHLNSLQSNSSILKNLREKRNIKPEQNLEDTREFMKILGIQDSNMDSLNIVYVSGTKGKGSTCAFTESILRGNGYKTGFYSSPHLVHVRERIRLNSIPVSEKLFAENFFEIYEKLRENEQSRNNMPAYFKFLTLMAFHIFIKEKVDVAVIEVGIGGEYDCTNVIRNPIVCGITTLDYDHTSILGNTITEIAWHKAGIMKNGSIAVCVDQSNDALEIIKNRANEKNCKLFFTPKIDEYDFPPNNLENNLPGHHQGTNLSLALQLSKIWLQKMGNNIFDEEELPKQFSILKGYKVPELFVKSLENCSWNGRGQIIQKDEINYFLDGAHTPKSIELCSDWYKNQHEKMKKNDTYQILLFTYCGFDLVLFTTTKLKPSLDKHLDSTNLNANEIEQDEKCKINQKIWKELTGNESELFECIFDALKRIQDESENKNIHVLVTGSLHLVGGVLGLLEGHE
uniref:Folylpolyglutamate synthase n=1 Tax=Panagrolaimus sp. JU765 TaxID=591449 RepID=A0AC34RFW1_9BILA